jgi:Protein of unknown function (DUF1592)/Protein of unknown function (DUF1588)/Protein of unknown function (DUF1595)/Protein of unknown function (DUF1587)/Protein of unknown function (DUF1585)/Ca-dependent carbohydrate-binding module xylan-binding
MNDLTKDPRGRALLLALSMATGGCYSGLSSFGRDAAGGDGAEGESGSGEGGSETGDTGEGAEELDPGRVTMHRLTNAEYDNTIRDLFFGLAVSPAADFPADEVSLGFDNISDVLSVTPVLFELYERAAEQTIELALTATGGAGSQRHEAETIGGTVGAVCCGGFWNLSSNGEIATTITVEADGDQQLVVRAYGRQAGPDLPHMVVSVDGATVAEIDVSAVEAAPAEHVVAVSLAAGNHAVSVAFTNDFYDPAASADRNLYIDWIELRPLGGPSSVRDLVLTCEPTVGAEAACAEEILSAFAKRAFRRPVTDAEVAGLVGLVQASLDDGQGWDPAISLGLQAVLVSPHFLFRVELDDDPTSLVPHPVSEHELASRLSYFVWSTMPDDELTELADGGTLSDPAVLAAQVRRMLEDPRAESLVDNFAGQWLYLRNLDYEIAKDYERFPEFDAELQASMKTEAEMFFRTFITEGRSLRDLLTGQDTFVDARLAVHYGIPVPEGEGFQRVSLEGLPRRGLLTQPGIMSVLAHPVTTSPVRRGKWVLEQLMCIHPPPPPPGVEVPPLAPEEGGTMRQQLEQHRADPACAGCHRLMDPIGLGLEHYDAIGRYRTMDAGLPIDATGELPSGETFTDALGMVELLADSDDFTTCTARKTLTYALGREPTDSDVPYLEEIVAEFETDGMTLEGLLVAVVTNDTFRMRRGEQ